MCVLPKTNKQEQNTSVENATWACVLPHISKYITANCISENQLTLKWKIGAHSCK